MQTINRKYYNKALLQYDKRIVQYINANLNEYIETNMIKHKEYIGKMMRFNLEKIKKKNIEFYIKSNELHMNSIDVLISYIIQMDKYKMVDNNFIYDKDITYIMKYEFDLLYNTNWIKYIDKFDINTVTKCENKKKLYNIFKNRIIKFNKMVINFEKDNEETLEYYSRTVYEFDYIFYHYIEEMYSELSSIMILYYTLVSKISKKKRKYFLEYVEKYFIVNIIINYDIII
jgi:hypothetical protein